ncbi:MAG: phosphoglycerate dehydrogenase [Candidatus Zapsychrus exili]|nr:phosphoglycerate dehydrogenase [Candidatus Zapsychrus exili]
MKKIFVTLSTFSQYGEEPLNLLKESGFEYKVNTLGRRLVKDEIVELAGDCNGVVAGVELYDAEVLDLMPSLECISRCGVGIDSIDHDKAKEKGVVIRNTPDVVIQPVAELTVAFIFDLLKKLTVHTILLKSDNWKKKAGNLLVGKKVGILGLGRIGKRTAEMLKVLGADILGADIAPDEAWAKEKEIEIVSTEELLKKSDIVSIHLANVESNPFVLGEKEISTMKDGSFLVNVARGQFVDEDALVEALKSGKIAGAAMDVFSKEPYLGPLCELDNVILTPHVATLTKESRLQMEIEATQNLLDFFNQNE